MTIQIQAKNVSEICEKLKRQLEEWPALMDIRTRVERAAPINKDTNRCPWVGIYRQTQAFTPRALGLGSGYRRHNITLALVVQEASLKSGQDCEERMERLISEVVSAICSDESIGGSVLALTEDPIAVSYSSYEVEQNNFYQEAVLLVTVTTNVSATNA